MSTGNGFDSNFKEQLANALQDLIDKIDDVLEDYEDNDEYEADEDDDEYEYDEDDDEYEYDEDDDEYEYDEVEEDDDIIETKAFEYDRNVFVVLGRALKFKSEYDSNGDLTRVLIGFGNQTPDLDDDDTVSMEAVYPDTEEKMQNWPKDLTAGINMMLRDGDSVHFLNEEHTEAFFTTHKRGTIGDETTILERVHFVVMEGQYIFELAANAYCLKHARNCGTTVDDNAFSQNIERLISIMESIRLEDAPFRFVHPDVDLIKKKLFLDVSFNDWIDYAENQGEALYNNVPESFEGNTVHQYSDTITFDLSNRYYMYYVMFINCVRLMRFVYRKQERANFYTFVEEITDEELRNLDALHRRYRENEKSSSIDAYGFGDPEHKVSLYAGKMLADDDEGMRGLCVNIVLGHRVLRIQDVYAARSDEDTTRELFNEIMSCVKEIAFSMRINDKPVRIPRFDFSDILEAVCKTMVLEKGEKDAGPWAEVPPTYTVKRGDISAKVWNNGVDPIEIEEEEEDKDSGLYDVSFDEQGMSGRYRRLTYVGKPNPIIEGIMRDYYKTEDEIRESLAADEDDFSDDEDTEPFEDPRSCFKTVTFGCFPQSDPTVSSPIEWLVLEERDEFALLISKYILGAAPYRGSDGIDALTWTLNIFTRFAFTKKEWKSSFNAAGLLRLKGEDVNSGCFFLGADDAKKYFATDELRQCGATYCAEQEGAFTDEDSGTCFWWLRDNGNCGLFHAVVQSEGRVSTYGVPNETRYVGIRPCIWVEKKALKQERRKAEKFDPAEKNPNAIYERAVNAMKEGRYTRAYNLFGWLGSYADCYKMRNECEKKWVEEYRSKKAAEEKKAAQNELSRADASRKEAFSAMCSAQAAVESTQAGLDAAEAEKARLTGELSQLRGLFTGKKKAQLNEQISRIEEQIAGLRLQHRKAATASTNAGKKVDEAEIAQCAARNKIAGAEAMMRSKSKPTEKELSAFWMAAAEEERA